MNKWGKKSLAVRATLDPRLVRVVDAVLKITDCSLVEGYRDKAAQDEAYRKGMSKLRWPESAHNLMPSQAVDIWPHPFPGWPDDGRVSEETRRRRWEHWALFAGVVLGVAGTLDVKIRWGGDWNGNFDPKDENWRDLPHFELAE